MKLTPWYTGKTKPVRVGEYERDFTGTGVGGSCIHYSHWNGKFWGLYDVTPSGAKRWSHAASADQNLPWRGVEK